MDAFIGLFFIIVLPIIAIFFIRKWYKLKKEFENFEKTKSEEITTLNSQISEQKDSINDLTNKQYSQEKKILNLSVELETLSKFKGVADADAEAKRILEDAQTQANESNRGAEENLKEAIEKAQKMIKEARDEAKLKTDSTDKTVQQKLNAAIENAERIVNDAQTKAKEIAGSALEAKEKAEEYVKTEKAMRNIIGGYGHRYLIPNISILDDLAEEFSWAEAGERLKSARAFTRTLIVDRKAATCDYVDNDKHNTAIKFVTDAFNGKVDSALSKVKYDNYGTIKQQIEDAFNVVNYTGVAFRNARISEIYLNARLDELKWAVATNELKKIEQDEQRRIKELMREEERAQREIQKAIDAAEKEEKILKKAMEEARKQIESANEEERLQFEAKLQDLQDKLTAAEEKNKRALSMAQQTRSGHVYVISNIGSFGENIYKIGMTRRLEPKDRVTELGDASVPFSFDIHAMIYSTDAPTLEKTLHKKFVNNQVNKVNPRKEFFDVTLADIRNMIDEMGIEAHWTMTAEAKEYYESQAMVKPLAFVEEEYQEEDL